MESVLLHAVEAFCSPPPKQHWGSDQELLCFCHPQGGESSPRGFGVAGAGVLLHAGGSRNLGPRFHMGSYEVLS